MNTHPNCKKANFSCFLASFAEEWGKYVGIVVNVLGVVGMRCHYNSSVWMQIFTMQAEKEGVPLPQGSRAANLH